MEDVEHLNYVNKLVFHHSSDHGKGKHRITEQVMILHFPFLKEMLTYCI